MIYVLAYPEFEPSVTDKIDRFRAANEPERFELVRPHITLAFAIADDKEAEVVAACKIVANESIKLMIKLMPPEIVFDPFEQAHKLCLVCADGRNALTAMHLRLNSEMSATPGNPFRPHLTVATNNDRASLERGDHGELPPLPIVGTIKALDVVQLAGERLTPIRTIPLREKG